MRCIRCHNSLNIVLRLLIHQFRVALRRSFDDVHIRRNDSLADNDTTSHRVRLTAAVFHNE